MQIQNTPEEDQDLDEATNLFKAYEEAVNQGDVQRVEEATLKVWEHLAENQDDEPSPWLEAVNEAHRCEAAFDWQGAEEAYQRAAQVSADQPGLEYGAYRRLSSLHQLLHDESSALEAAVMATEASRRSNMPSLLTLALQAEASLHLQAKNFGATWKLITETFDVLEEGPMHDLPRSYALIGRCDYFIENYQMGEAEADLKTAWAIIEPWAELYFAGGWQASFAGWWAATARLRSKNDDQIGVVAAWNEAVARRRIITELPQLEGPYKHNSLAVTLRHLGRAQRIIKDPLATESFQESRSIREAIGLLPLEES